MFAIMPLRFIPDIHRATHRIALYLEESGDLGVNQAEAHVLAHLAAFGDSTVADIHKAFAHKRSTLTSILDRLSARRLITRHSSEADRRTFVIKLTGSGRKLAAEVYRHLQAFEERVLQSVSKEELKNFLRVLGVAEERPHRRPRSGEESPRRKRSAGSRASGAH
jgi:DNA-binding MarR family transcriptional regulator